MLNILIFILIFSSFDVIQSEFTCSIENKNKIKCLPDFSNAAGNLEINCVRVGCCYQKVEEDGYPFCYYNTLFQPQSPQQFQPQSPQQFQPQSPQQFQPQFP